MFKILVPNFTSLLHKPKYALKNVSPISKTFFRSVTTLDNKYSPENYQKLYNSLTPVHQKILKTPDIKMARILKTFTQDQINQSEYERFMHISSKSPWLLKTNSPTIVAVAELFRIDKPAGTYLLLTPCIWSLTMSSIMLLSSYHGLTPPLIENVTQFALQTTLFIVGAYTMRSAGCVINDMHDRELDFKVWRSLQRPIACGRISYSEAWAALVVLSAIGIAILYYGLPWQCWWLGLASLPLIFVYPLFKRFTYYPQIVLSSCFNWGSLLGFAAIFGGFLYPYSKQEEESNTTEIENKSLEMKDLPWRPMAGLYLTTFLWCMIYDTIYAHQDKKFDIKANIKSTALKWGSKSKPILYVLALVQCLALFDSCYDAGLIGQTKIFSTAGMLTFDYLLFRMIYKVNLDNPANCWHYFRRNVKYGQAFTVGLLLEYFYQLFKAANKEEQEEDNSNRRLE